MQPGKKKDQWALTSPEYHTDTLPRHLVRRTHICTATKPLIEQRKIKDGTGRVIIKVSIN